MQQPFIQFMTFIMLFIFSGHLGMQTLHNTRTPPIRAQRSPLPRPTCESACVYMYYRSMMASRTSPRRSPRLRLLRELLTSSSSEIPQLRRSPRGLSRRLVSNNHCDGTRSVLGKRAPPCNDATPSKRSKECFDIDTTTERAIQTFGESLNFTSYCDRESNLLVIVTPKLVYSVRGVGKMARVRLVVRSTGNYFIQVCLLWRR